MKKKLFALAFEEFLKTKNNYLPENFLLTAFATLKE